MAEMSKEWKMPKNVRQIGEGGKDRKLYVEDYVITFLEGLASEEEPKNAVLLGEVREHELHLYIFVSGAVEIEGTGEEDLAQETIRTKMQQYFPGKSVVGWFLPEQDAFPENKEPGADFCKENQVLIVREEAEEETCVYMTEEKELVKQPGYYIYYEKNPAMQEYMVSRNEGKSVEKEQPVKDDAIRRFRKIVREKKKMPQVQMPAPGRLVYFAGGLLVVTILALGATMVYNYDKMKEVERSLARLTNNVDSQSGYLEEQNAAQVMLHIDNDLALQKETETESEAATEAAGRNGGLTQETEMEEINTDAAQTMQTDAVQSESTQTVQTEQQTESEADDTEVPASAAARASYTVKAGDTLAGISEMYYGNLEKVSEICTLNGIDDENTILPGQKILLP